MKIVFTFTLGLAVGILFFFILVTNINELADIINTIAIIVNIGLAVSITYFLPKKITSSRYVIEYFMSQLENIRNEYDLFIKEIKKGELETHEISKEFKNFTMKFEDLDYFLTSNIKLKNVDLQVKNRLIHRHITNSNEYNNTTSGNKVLLNNITTIRLMNLHMEINHYITEVVISINDK